MVSPSISPDLAQHYQKSLTTLARCVRIERQDGVVLGVTEHDHDILFEGVHYQSAAGYQSTAIQKNTGLAVGTVEVEGILSAAGVDKQAIISGLFDEARVEVFEVNYQDFSQGKFILSSGYWGETHLQGSRYVCEFRSLAQTLQQPLGECYSATCRAQLGDAHCQVSLEKFTHPAVVTAVISATEIAAEALTQVEGYFQYGKLQWTEGANAHLLTAIKRFKPEGPLVLVEPSPYPVQVGDPFIAIAGCDKRFSTCVAKFNNALNFRGEPFVPGQDQLAQYPGVAGEGG